MFNGSISSWISHVETTHFLLWVYRRGYTPYEMDKRFEDQSLFEDSRADVVKIVEFIKLDDGDYLLGVETYDEIEEKYYNRIDYYKLSEVRLARKKCTNDELFDDDGAGLTLAEV